MIKLAFVSNYLSHHQTALSDELYHIYGEQFAFIEMEEMDSERIGAGWELHGSYPYRISYFDSPKTSQEIIDNADCVVVGPVKLNYYSKRIAAGKLVIRYEERSLKRSDFEWLNPRVMWMMLKAHVSVRKKNVYMLCANAYNSIDMNRFCAYPGKMYSWGYFPQYYDYGEKGPQKEETRTLRLIWVARYIKWKHPELPIKIAEHLRKNQMDFSLTMIGRGELYEKYRKIIRDKGLESYITQIESVAYDEMSKHMLGADVLLMTSDRNEGWGAVVNEALNQGCIVIGNREAGSVPWLVQDGENGFSYKNVAELLEVTKRVLLMDVLQLKKMQHKAYLTIRDEWNANNAAMRLAKFIDNPNCYDSPCSGPMVKL